MKRILCPLRTIYRTTLSLDLSERGTDLANKTRVLIVAEAWLDLAERTTPLVERESGEAHRIIERPLSNVTTPRYRSAAD